MTVLEILSVVLLVTGGFFFLAGTVGMLRFPDVYTRLHALAKVDNLGLGFTIVALMLRAPSWALVGKLALIWLLALVASATASYLIAHNALAHGVHPWRAPSGGRRS